MASFFSTSTRLHKLNYETKQIDAILAAPITNLSFLISIIMRGFLFGMIQFIFSLIITSFLNNEYFGMLNILLISSHVFIIVLFFSILGVMFGLIIENMMFLMQSSIFLFMFLSLGMDLFIPINVFPESYSIILNKVPLVTLFNNIQHVIIPGKINWIGYFITLFISLTLFFITLIICNKVLRKI
jgi:ABC-type polysaccharide/polyol phosphate export permease